jgi:hypothetical protein
MGRSKIANKMKKDTLGAHPDPAARIQTEAYDTVLQCMRRVEELYALPADPEVKAKGMAETLLVMRKKIFQ